MLRSIAIIVGLFSTSAFADTLDTWAFLPNPDDFSDAAILDLSYLNEQTAGETGFIHRSADGSAFVRGDGAPIRFWAVNSYVANQGMSELREHAQFLAARQTR